MAWYKLDKNNGGLARREKLNWIFLLWFPFKNDNKMDKNLGRNEISVTIL